MMADEALKKWLDEELPKAARCPSYEDGEDGMDSVERGATAAYRAGDCAGVKRTLEHVANRLDTEVNKVDQVRP